VFEAIARAALDIVKDMNRRRAAALAGVLARRPRGRFPRRLVIKVIEEFTRSARGGGFVPAGGREDS